MNETAVMHTDLDRLADRVEKAAALVQQLRDDRARLERERDDLTERLRQTEGKLQGQDVPALLQEISALKREQHDWQTERRDVAAKIEALLRKLESLES